MALQYSAEPYQPLVFTVLDYDQGAVDMPFIFAVFVEA